MKRILIAGAASLALLLTTTLTTARASGVRYTHCSTTYYAPQYLTIRHIRQHGTTCTVAHGLARSYMRAVTQSSGAGGTRTGHCFGEHSYGRCVVRFRHKAWDCFHYDVVPKRTRGLVSCTRPGKRVKFNIGT